MTVENTGAGKAFQGGLYGIVHLGVSSQLCELIALYVFVALAA